MFAAEGKRKRERERDSEGKKREAMHSCMLDVLRHIQSLGVNTT